MSAQQAQDNLVYAIILERMNCARLGMVASIGRHKPMAALDQRCRKAIITGIHVCLESMDRTDGEIESTA